MLRFITYVYCCLAAKLLDLHTIWYNVIKWVKTLIVNSLLIILYLITYCCIRHAYISYSQFSRSTTNITRPISTTLAPTGPYVCLHRNAPTSTGTTLSRSGGAACGHHDVTIIFVIWSARDVTKRTSDVVRGVTKLVGILCWRQHTRFKPSIRTNSVIQHCDRTERTASAIDTTAWRSYCC